MREERLDTSDIMAVSFARMTANHTKLPYGLIILNRCVLEALNRMDDASVHLSFFAVNSCSVAMTNSKSLRSLISRRQFRCYINLVQLIGRENRFLSVNT